MVLKRAEYMLSLIEKIRNDPSSGFYVIEYKNDWYNENFHRSELEKKNRLYFILFRLHLLPQENENYY